MHPVVLSASGPRVNRTVSPRFDRENCHREFIRSSARTIDYEMKVKCQCGLCTEQQLQRARFFVLVVCVLFSNDRTQTVRSHWRKVGLYFGERIENDSSLPAFLKGNKRSLTLEQSSAYATPAGRSLDYIHASVT